MDENTTDTKDFKGEEEAKEEEKEEEVEGEKEEVAA